MHSSRPPVRGIAWRNDTSGSSTSCASHHAYPTCTSRLGHVIHVDGCTTRSLDIGKALSYLLASLYIHIRHISFLHRNMLITRCTCSSTFIVSVPANIDAYLHQCLTRIKETTNMHCMPTILAVLSLVFQARANAVLNYSQQACNHLLPKPHQGCLRGQTCLENNS